LTKLAYSVYLTADLVAMSLYPLDALDAQHAREAGALSASLAR